MMHIACIAVSFSLTQQSAAVIIFRIRCAMRGDAMKCEKRARHIPSAYVQTTVVFCGSFFFAVVSEKKIVALKARAKRLELRPPHRTQHERLNFSTVSYKYVFQVQLFACVIHFFSFFRCFSWYHFVFEGSRCCCRFSLPSQLFVHGSHKWFFSFITSFSHHIYRSLACARAIDESFFQMPLLCM